MTDYNQRVAVNTWNRGTQTVLMSLMSKPKMLFSVQPALGVSFIPEVELTYCVL